MLEAIQDPTKRIKLKRVFNGNADIPTFRTTHTVMEITSIKIWRCVYCEVMPLPIVTLPVGTDRMMIRKIRAISFDTGKNIPMRKIEAYFFCITIQFLVGHEFFDIEDFHINLYFFSQGNFHGVSPIFVFFVMPICLDKQFGNKSKLSGEKEYPSITFCQVPEKERSVRRVLMAIARSSPKDRCFR